MAASTSSALFIGRVGCLGGVKRVELSQLSTLLRWAQRKGDVLLPPYDGVFVVMPLQRPPWITTTAAATLAVIFTLRLLHLKVTGVGGCPRRP